MKFLKRLAPLENRHMLKYVRQLSEGISSAIIVQRATGNVVYANTAAKELLGFDIGDNTARDLQGMLCLEDGTPLQLAEIPQITRRQSAIQPFMMELKVSTPGQKVRWVLCNSDVLKGTAANCPEEIVTTLMDITERKHSQMQQDLLKEISEKVLLEQPIDEVLKYTCKQLVNTLDDYPLAWIGMKEPDGSISAHIIAGIGGEYTSRGNVRWDDTPKGGNPVGCAIRTGKTQIHKVKENPLFQAWWPVLDELGVQVVAALPLNAHGETLGVLAVYAKQQDSLDANRITQLEYLANQVAVALTVSAQRNQLVRYNVLTESMRDICLLLDLNGRIIDVNQAALDVYGYSRNELLTMQLHDLRTPEGRETISEHLRLSLENDLLYESFHRRKDGNVFPVEVKAQAANVAGEKLILNIVRDINERKKAQFALEESDQRRQEILEYMGHAVAVYEVCGDGEDFIVNELNQAAGKIAGMPKEQIIGHSVTDGLQGTAQSRALLDAFRRVWRTGNPEYYPVIFSDEGQVTSWRDNYIYKLSSGELVAVFEDVTTRKLTEEEVWREKERAQVTLDSIGDAVITTDIAGNVEILNPLAEKLTGWAKHLAVGKPILKVFNLKTDAASSTGLVIKSLQEGNSSELPLQSKLMQKDGSELAIEGSIAPIRNRKGKVIGAVLVFRDVSEKRKLMAQLDYQEYHDKLTGLPNRVLFNERLLQTMSQARRERLMAGVVCINLDRFKMINDTFGHTAGDSVLQVAAERLKGCLRNGDTVARQGGDEFLIVLRNLENEGEAALVAHRIREAFTRPFAIDGREVTITAGMGVALYPLDGDNIEKLVKHADTAMYYAKAQGRHNYQFYNKALDKDSGERLFLENSLRKALANHEFGVYYQPQVELASGQIVGLEALARWHSPERGLVPPSEFIPIAEETGLIVPLGEWVLRTACAQLRSWQLEGYPLRRVTVNLSARQFRQPDLISKIGEILEETGLDPDSLELEITESIAMESVDFTIAMLNTLRQMGIRISIDDFGTGYSSLNYLRRLPLDTIKIDKSFVQDIGLSQNGEEIVNTIIDLAKNIKLKVIAEGIETPVQLDFVRTKKCDEMQGYLFSKPVPSEQLEDMLRDKRQLEA